MRRLVGPASLIGANLRPAMTSSAMTWPKELRLIAVILALSSTTRSQNTLTNATCTASFSWVCFRHSWLWILPYFLLTVRKFPSTVTMFSYCFTWGSMRTARRSVYSWQLLCREFIFSAGVQVPALPVNNHYLPPSPSQTTTCKCSTITYMLISACAACQSREWIAWQNWIMNCPIVELGVYVVDIIPDLHSLKFFLGWVDFRFSCHRQLSFRPGLIWIYLRYGPFKMRSPKIDRSGRSMVPSM